MTTPSSDPAPCGVKAYVASDWMSRDQADAVACACTLPAGHEGHHACEHTSWPPSSVHANPAAPGETAVPAQAPEERSNEALAQVEADLAEFGTRTLYSRRIDDTYSRDYAAERIISAAAIVADELRYRRGELRIEESNVDYLDERLAAAEAELRATEGDLGVAVQVAAERADALAAATARADYFERNLRSMTLSKYRDNGDWMLLNARGLLNNAPGVGAATGTKGDQP